MTDDVIKMTAYDWLTSQQPAAVEWRREAVQDEGMRAAGAVIDLAAKSVPLARQFAQPAERIQRPPTRIGRYFQVNEYPRGNSLEAQPKRNGQFFDLPQRAPAPAGKFFVIPKEG